MNQGKIMCGLKLETTIFPIHDFSVLKISIDQRNMKNQKVNFITKNQIVIISQMLRVQKSKLQSRWQLLTPKEVILESIVTPTSEIDFKIITKLFEETIAYPLTMKARQIQIP